MTGAVRGCWWVARLAALNLLWVAFSLLGGGVLGVMPATAAVFMITRHWVRPVDDIRVMREFWAVYRSSFWRANAFGYVLAGLGYLLYTDFSVVRVQRGAASVGLSVLFITFLIAYALLALYAFPLFVHARLSLPRYFAWAFAYGLGHPLLTATMAGGVGGALLVMIVWFPALLPFFGISVPAWITMWGAHRAFVKHATGPGLRVTQQEVTQQEVSRHEDTPHEAAPERLDTLNRSVVARAEPEDFLVLSQPPLCERIELQRTHATDGKPDRHDSGSGTR